MRTTRYRADAAEIAGAARRVMDRCDELAGVTAASGAITRVYLSPEHARANGIVGTWMREAGLRVRQDAAGNLIGRIDPAGGPAVGGGAGAGATQGDAPAIVLGSHLDTVPDAGRYDGIVGVLTGIEVARMLAVRDDAGVPRSPFDAAIEVVAFWDEEGTRFGRALLGSSAYAGEWEPEWWSLEDADGVSLRDAFVDFGLDPARVGEAARAADELVGYLEAHIEQGPELDRMGEGLAVVSSIASARRFRLVVEGEARHAGGTPYDMRRDALLGASEAALAIERICRGEHHIIGTVGQFEAYPGAVNVVPGEAHLSLDLRGEFDADRDRVWNAISGELDRIFARRGLRWRARETHRAAAGFCAPLLQDVVRAGIGAAGVFGGARAAGGAGVSAFDGGRAAAVRGAGEATTLFSRAGHDAMALGSLTDVGMLFLRNPDGISHHPDEGVGERDVAAGMLALAEAVAHLGHEPR
ncbi:MAG: Zn-dependent hydrolase [Pseudoclavibacter sp.]